MGYALSLEYPHITSINIGIKYTCAPRGRIAYQIFRGLEYENYIPFSTCQSTPDHRVFFSQFELNIEPKTFA